MMRQRFSPSRPLSLWPGFVDALSALLLVFLLFIFFLMMAGLEVKGSLYTKQTLIDHLQKKSTRLDQDLKTHKVKTKNLEHIRNEKEASIRSLQQDVEVLNEHVSALDEEIVTSKAMLSEKEATIEALEKKNRVLLEASQKRVDAHRSQFMAKLKGLLEKEKGVRIVDDRFVIQSEVLYPSGSEVLSPLGKENLDMLAQSLRELSQKISPAIPWVLRIDGHTDCVPMRVGARFSSNLGLSLARARAVADYLKSQGIPEKHLVPSGFAEHYPLDKGHTQESYAKNRRIEFKLDQR
ncbi:OmpA family protein [Candidatus Hepatobacter penaei]|uniref:OmpA family protein n=1 Tax=Candidatus Hepatobacter penaei TaxID=1274402 RepID=UPI0006968EBD|nr:OmpA family protein [Candidatus Hepatobacter penaei]